MSQTTHRQLAEGGRNDGNHINFLDTCICDDRVLKVGINHLQVCVHISSKHITSFFLGTGDVWFSFRNRTYQNNSIVILKDIGEGDDALFCMTNQTACCQRSYTSGMKSTAIGNWFFPNGTRVPSSGDNWDFHRTRGQMVVRLQRRRGGEEGIYRCVIPDTMNVTQTIYIGVYSASTGE